MEKGQSEVTNKIRSAIKQKLSEISDFVDDELPEYIMILVANQRSKSQIEKDLSLFLRNDTVNFTNWLWDLLNNLKVGTQSNQSSIPNNVDAEIGKTDFDADDDAVILGFDPDEHEADFLNCENTNDSIISKSTTDVKREPSVAKSIQNSKHVEKSKIRTISPVKTSKKLSTHSSKGPLSSAVIPVKRKLTDVDDEYDPAKPEYERFRCNSGPRNYCGPAALQANKLLLKAVDDATKSILKGKNIEDYYKPTPIKILSSKRTNDSDSSMSHKEVNPCKRRKNPIQEIKPEYETVVERLAPEILEFNINEYPPDILMEGDGDTEDTASSQKSRTIHLKSIPLDSDSLDFESHNCSPVDNYSYSFEPVEEVRPKSPHFIVTLDGVSRTSFNRKFEENSVDSMEDDEEDDRDELLPNEADTTSEKKLKLNERCKYWPACKNSDQCLYHHPTVPCKCFPDCKFGDKCLYIHPNCKFDALCSRKDCPFTHVSKRKLPIIAVPVKMVPVPIKNRKTKVVCKFYPKCTAKNCPFIHPKLCRYGKECRLPACIFTHFPVPSRSQMKWQAAIS